MSRLGATPSPGASDAHDGHCGSAAGAPDHAMSPPSALPSPAVEDPAAFAFTDQEMEDLLLLVDRHSSALARGDSGSGGAGAPAVGDAELDASPGEAKRAHSVALAAKRRREYQRRQKTELADLRQESAALGEELASLASRKEARRLALRRAGRGHRNATSWREIALRQLQLRAEAEKANRTLRLLVHQKHVAVRSLSLMLRSELTIADSDNLAALGCLQGQGKEVVQLCDADLAAVLSLADEINATHGRSDTVLGDHRVSAADGRHFASWTGWRENPLTGAGCFESIVSWGIPFDVDVAVGGMIKSLPSLLSRECQPASIPTADPANMMAIKFFFSWADAERRERYYESIFVVKTFVEGDRVILRWRFVSKERGPGGNTNGEQFIESGCGVAHREAAAPVDHHEPVGTRIRLCTRFGVVGPNGSTAARSQSLKGFIDMLSTDAEDDIMEWNHAIEEAVMNGAIAARGICSSGA